MADTPHRIQLKRAKGWRKPPGAVSVARPGPWGNPFKVGIHGSAAECVAAYAKLIGADGAGTLIDNTGGRPAFEDRLRVQQHVRANIGSLRGKNLACWCPLDQPCHADALLEAANRKD